MELLNQTKYVISKLFHIEILVAIFGVIFCTYYNYSNALLICGLPYLYFKFLNKENIDKVDIWIQSLVLILYASFFFLYWIVDTIVNLWEINYWISLLIVYSVGFIIFCNILIYGFIYKKINDRSFIFCFGFALFIAITENALYSTFISIEYGYWLFFVEDNWVGQLSEFSGGSLITFIMMFTALLAANNKYKSSLIVFISANLLGFYLLNRDLPLTNGKTFVGAQPNIQKEIRNSLKINKEDGFSVIQKQENIIRNNKDFDKADFVVWGETSYPYTIGDPSSVKESNMEQYMLNMFSDKTFIFGSLIKTEYGVKNAIVNINNGKMSFTDKEKLFPFGEYIPFIEDFPSLNKVFATYIPHSISATSKYAQRFIDNIGDLKYGSAICYEILFKDISRDRVLNDADFILNLGQGAWFPVNPTKIQKNVATFESLYARIRAVENRKYVVRVSNTGVSALIDYKGQYVSYNESSEGEQSISGKVYKVNYESMFVKYGDWFKKLAIVLLTVILIFRIRYKKRS